MRTGIQALAVLLFFLATLTLFSGRPRATGFLAARVAALEAESNRQPVVIDANGVEVGTPIGASGNRVRVLMDYEGFPVFMLEVFKEGLEGSTGSIAFESNDCSGIPLIGARVRDDPLPTVFLLRDGSGITLLSLHPGVTERIEVASSMDVHGVCSPYEASLLSAPGTPVPEMEALFTPPFEVVTRGDLTEP